MEEAQSNNARKAPLKDGPEIQYAKFGLYPTGNRKPPGQVVIWVISSGRPGAVPARAGLSSNRQWEVTTSVPTTKPAVAM